ncbi:MAG: hypothetical protein K2N14_00275 [Clostridia bacterium]|nr:hypothetical protein [Clostridia bacterium]
MKIKKALPLILSLFMVGGVFAGCTQPDNGDNNDVGGGKTEHVHNYENWTSDGANTHTGTCTATEGECDAKTKTEDHVYDNDTDTTCNKCDYVREVGSEQPNPPASDTSTPLPAGKKIYVVGDSTVCSFNDSYYLPRYGYGTQLAEYLNVTSDQVVNLALSGRSSKSFTYGLDVDDKNKNSISGDKSCYEYLTTNISEGDYLIIGFGHNDEKSEEAARYTDANGTYDQATTANGDSFAYTLYNYYVKMATDKGATPILCTPIVRYSNTGDYSTDKAHNTTSTDKLGKGGDYAKAIRDLGTATNTTVIDLTSLTKAVYESNNTEAQYYHAHTSYSGEKPNETPNGRDDTHINKYGAKMVAYQFAQALKNTDCALKAQVKTNTSAPTKAVDYADAIKADFVVPDYTPFDPSAHEDACLTGEWYGTTMGDVGGQDKVPNFSVTHSGGKFTVGNSTAHGKFASGSDGFAAAFMQIDASKNFTASATVTVTNVATGTSNQTGFGMMLRDDILINTHDNTIKSNYVAAGVLSLKGAIFSRENGALSSAAKTNTAAVAKDDTYNVSITRVGQTVTVTVGDATKTYTDFDFVARDNGYMYLCLFANRSVTVEFTNVQFEITGESQGA